MVWKLTCSSCGMTLATIARANDPDRDLLAAAKCGDGASIATLIERRRGAVLRAAQSITRNHADAEEVMQNAFFLAFRNLHSFQGEALFSTWLVRIAVNQSLTALRTRRPCEVLSESADTGDPGLSPEECLSQRETQEIVAAAIGQLKPSFRAAIEVHYLQENSTKDTARILQLSAEALKSRLHRARRELRHALKKLAPAIASPAF